VLKNERDARWKTLTGKKQAHGALQTPQIYNNDDDDDNTTT